MDIVMKNDALWSPSWHDMTRRNAKLSQSSKSHISFWQDLLFGWLGYFFLFSVIMGYSNNKKEANEYKLQINEKNQVGSDL